MKLIKEMSHKEFKTDFVFLSLNFFYRIGASEEGEGGSRNLIAQFLSSLSSFSQLRF